MVRFKDNRISNSELYFIFLGLVVVSEIFEFKYNWIFYSILSAYYFIFPAFLVNGKGLVWGGACVLICFSILLAYWGSNPESAIEAAYIVIAALFSYFSLAIYAILLNRQLKGSFSRGLVLFFVFMFSPFLHPFVSGVRKSK